MHRQDQHPGRGKRGLDLRRGLDAVQLPHGDVHDDQVGLLGLGDGDRVAAVVRPGDDGDAFDFLEQRANPAQDQGVIVCKQDADGIHEFAAVAGWSALP